MVWVSTTEKGQAVKYTDTTFKCPECRHEVEDREIEMTFELRDTNVVVGNVPAKVCPNCGYEDGFHSAFEKMADQSDVSWRLICPSCHRIYDIGLTVSIM